MAWVIAMGELITKSEFAKRMGKTPAAVTQWRDKKLIGDDAVVARGKREMIIYEVAKTQVEARMDLGQAAANGRGKASEYVVSPAELSPPAEAADDPIIISADQNVTEAYNRERVKKLRLDNQQREADLKKARGQYMDSVAADEAMAKLTGTILRAFEGEMPKLTDALVSAFDVPKLQVKQLLADHLNAIREKLAKQLTDQIADYPDYVEVDNDDTLGQPAQTVGGSGDQSIDPAPGNQL